MISLKKYLFLFLLSSFFVSSPIDGKRVAKLSICSVIPAAVLGIVVYKHAPYISSDFYYELKYRHSSFLAAVIGGSCMTCISLTSFLYNKTDFFKTS